MRTASVATSGEQRCNLSRHLSSPATITKTRLGCSDWPTDDIPSPDARARLDPAAPPQLIISTDSAPPSLASSPYRLAVGKLDSRSLRDIGSSSVYDLRINWKWKLAVRTVPMKFSQIQILCVSLLSLLTISGYIVHASVRSTLKIYAF